MKEIKMILDDINSENISELLLEYTGTYSPDIITIKMNMNNDIEIISDGGEIKDTFYGRKIQDKYYFARHEAISKEKPHINYYDEFFSSGEVLQLYCWHGFKSRGCSNMEVGKIPTGQKCP